MSSSITPPPPSFEVVVGAHRRFTGWGHSKSFMAGYSWEFSNLVNMWIRILLSIWIH